MKELDLSRTFIGKVEVNEDPNKLGRCRVRVLDVFDNIPTEDIPWASPFNDTNGNQFFVPEVGKIVSVYFENANLYTPIYKYAEHYNVNLQEKLNSLSGNDYTSMRSIMFDNKTQIFSNDSDGLMMDYKFNQINIDNDSVDINLKDNNSIVNIGTPNSTQDAILGTNFLNWFDELVDELLGAGNAPGPYLGNLQAPIVPAPSFIQILLKYKSLKDPKFLSDNVKLVDNGYVSPTDRIEINQKGDDWRSTIEENELVQKDNDSFKGQNVAKDWTPEGTLTPASDGTPTSVLSDQAIDQQAPTTEVNPEIESLLKVLRDKNYVVYERPYEVNTIGVRYQYPGQEYSNKFKDRIYAIWKDDKGNWKSRYWMVSTIPGRNSSWRQGSPLLKDAVGKSRGGLGIMKPAQYVNVYQLGYFRENNKSARAMKAIGRQLAYRDQNYGSAKITFSNEDPANSRGGKNFAMHIHKAYTLKNGKGTNVNNWSEGCQVFPSAKTLNEYFDICEVHKSKYGNKFTYTLVTSKDVDNAQQAITQENKQREINSGNI